jgi:hypothetical protein
MRENLPNGKKVEFHSTTFVTQKGLKEPQKWSQPMGENYPDICLKEPLKIETLPPE